MLSSVANEVSLSAKNVRIATIGDARANNNKYNFDFDSSTLICFKNQETPKAARPLCSIIAKNTITPVSVLLDTEAPTASPSAAA